MKNIINMNNITEIRKALGPCGLNCKKCFANVNGSIGYHSRKLREFLGNFNIYAERFVTLLNEPKFENYPAFKIMLDYFTKASCKGCRDESCKLFKDCGVKECYNEKEVDFCFQCDEFPCDKTNFDEHLRKRWVAINQRMKEIGIENYYKEIKEKSRY